MPISSNAAESNSTHTPSSGTRSRQPRITAKFSILTPTTSQVNGRQSNSPIIPKSPIKLGHRCNQGFIPPVSLEEVLAEKLEREEKKYAEEGFRMMRAQAWNCPTRQCRQANPVLLQAKRQLQLLKEEKLHQKTASKFQSEIPLPALRVILTTDTMAQDFNFAIQPSRERAFLKAEQNKEQHLLQTVREDPDVASRSEAFACLPPPLLAQEPFLQFLADKVQEESKEAQAWQQQLLLRANEENDPPSPTSDDAVSSNRRGSAEMHPNAIAQQGRSNKSNAAKRPLGIPMAVAAHHHLVAGGPPRSGQESPSHQRALSATQVRPSFDLESARPATAEGGKPRVFKNRSLKRQAMQELVQRQDQHSTQLVVLSDREDEIKVLRQRLDTLKAQGSVRGLDAEVEAQMRALEEQEAHLRSLRHAITTPRLPSAAYARQQQVEWLQDATRKHLLETMVHHAHTNALALQRAKERQQHSTQKLLLRQRLHNHIVDSISYDPNRGLTSLGAQGWSPLDSSATPSYSDSSGI